MARLEDVCEILDSKRIPITASDRIAGPYPYYGANGVQDYVADYIFDDDLILLAEDGGNFGSKDRPIAYRVFGKCWVNNHAHVLKPKVGYDVGYVCYSLMYYDVSGLVNGATRQKLTQADMRKMIIPERTLEEQQHIALILERIDGLLSLRKQQLAKLDELVKSRFVEMFEGKYPEVMIGDKIETTSGGTPSSKHSEFYDGGKIPWLTSGEVNLGYIHRTERNITELGLKSSSAKWVPRNSVVIAMYGATAGKVGLITIPLTTNQAVCTLLPSKDFEPLYLYYAVKKNETWMLEHRSGAAQPNISHAIIRKMKIICAPIEEQKRFSLWAELIDKSKLTIRKSLDKLEVLKKSLMQQYFS